MANLKFDIDIKEIASVFKELKESVKKDLVEGVENLASMTHARVLELARDKLGSLSNLYSENVEFTNPEKGFWVVTLKAPAMWIEEGYSGGFMDFLLSGKSAKTSKDGKKYAVIPFEHSKRPSEQAPKARELTNQIKTEFKKRKINWKKIENNPDGSPRLGRLHQFNIESARPSPKAKYPALQGVAVYQARNKMGGVSRDVMTFRVISESHEAEGLWNRQNKDGEKLLDLAFDWALETWSREILPAIFEKYK